MNKNNLMVTGILALGLVFSLTGNLAQYNKTMQLEQTIDKLQEQDKATAVAKMFVSLLMSKPSKENETKMRQITTQKAQSQVFAKVPDEDSDGDLSGIQQQIVLDKTYFNRIDPDHVNVIVKYHINYQVGNKSTVSFYEMSLNLVRESTWKVDSYDMSENDTGSLTSGKEGIK